MKIRKFHEDYSRPLARQHAFKSVLVTVNGRYPDNWQLSHGSHVVNTWYQTRHVFVITSPKNACMRQSWTTQRYGRVGHSIDEEFDLVGLATEPEQFFVRRCFLLFLLADFRSPLRRSALFCLADLFFYRVIASCNISGRIMARENMPRRKYLNEEMAKKKIRRTENCHETHGRSRCSCF